jgi:uncharacterized cupredoxin-like copper-binding protein
MQTFSALLLAVAVAGLACQQAPAAGPGGAITATFTDTNIQLSDTSVSNGKVTFTVKNSGSVMHSLVVLKTNLADDKIPASDANPSKADERGSLGATGQIAPGETKQFTFDLTAGKYVLKPAHYLVGMHIGFVVK